MKRLQNAVEHQFFFNKLLRTLQTIVPRGLLALEALMRQFIKNMSREDKQTMMQEFMDSITGEEKTEMINLMIPVMMKDMKPGMMMANILENFDEKDCKKMMMEMSPEMKEKCRKIMEECQKACE